MFLAFIQTTIVDIRAGSASHDLWCFGAYFEAYVQPAHVSHWKSHFNLFEVAMGSCSGADAYWSIAKAEYDWEPSLGLDIVVALA